MKNGCFEVGDVVRIGGYIPEYDSNYHKIGTVISIGKDGYPHVRMIDEWSIPIQNGIVRHLPPDAWELAPNSFIGVSSLL